MPNGKRAFLAGFLDLVADCVMNAPPAQDVVPVARFRFT